MGKTARKPSPRRKAVQDPLLISATETPIGYLIPSSENSLLYRKRDIGNPDDARFAQSIATEGVLDPILVSLDWFVISGHGRLWAAQLAGFATVPIRVANIWRKDYTEAGWLALLREHNEQRIKGIDERIRELMLDANKDDQRAYVANRLANSTLAPVGLTVNGIMRRKAISAAKRPMLDAILDILESNIKFWPYSVRRLHYAIVSRDPPPLIHAGKPDSRYDNTQRCYKALVELVTRGRLAGLIDMAAISDETRPVQLWRTFPNVASFVGSEFKSMFTTFWRDLMQSQSRQFAIVAEKLTIAPIVESIAAEYCIPMVTARGYCSLEPRYAMAKRFRESGKRQLVLLLLTDHDPDGEGICESFVKSLRDDFDIANIHAIKVAITAEQVTKYKIPPILKAKKTSSRYGRFVSEYGDDVHELEALAPEQLQEILREAINGVIDVDAYNAEIEAEKRDVARLTAIRKAVLDTVKDLDLGEGGVA
ncbi:MAG: chromosome partitioning protein ParB [Planctomycetota bacterium]|nr:MAG: chromosome partitioning protein ParB [Planctomycetota bacterium]